MECCTRRLSTGRTNLRATHTLMLDCTPTGLIVHNRQERSAAYSSTPLLHSQSTSLSAARAAVTSYDLVVSEGWDNCLRGAETQRVHSTGGIRQYAGCIASGTTQCGTQCCCGCCSGLDGHSPTRTNATTMKQALPSRKQMSRISWRGVASVSMVSTAIEPWQPSAPR